MNYSYKKIRYWRRGIAIPRLVALVLGLIGLCFFGVGAGLLIADATFRGDAVETTALVLSAGEYTGTGSYGTYLEYEVDGEIVHSGMSESSSEYRPGDRITIYYDSDNPYRVRGNVVRVLGIIFAAVGAPLLITGIILLIASIRRARRNKKLMREGERIYAPIVDVSQVEGLRINYIYPYLIHCQWADGRTGQAYNFKSDYILSGDPTALLQARGVSYMPVYINPENPAHYYMDFSEIETQ